MGQFQPNLAQRQIQEFLNGLIEEPLYSSKGDNSSGKIDQHLQTT